MTNTLVTTTKIITNMIKKVLLRDTVNGTTTKIKTITTTKITIKITIKITNKMAKTNTTIINSNTTMMGSSMLIHKNPYKIQCLKKISSTRLTIKYLKATN